MLVGTIFTAVFLSSCAPRWRRHGGKYRQRAWLPIPTSRPGNAPRKGCWLALDRSTVKAVSGTIRGGQSMTRTRSGSLAAGGLNWDSLPLKLFAGGNAKFWDPADIDFSRDREDWESLSELERDWATRLCAEFIAGEEAVTQDIQPFMA